MKKHIIWLHVLLMLSAILFPVGGWVLIRLSSRPADFGMIWPWLLCLPAGGAGLLYVGREYRR